MHKQVLQETDIIAEGRIKARAAPAAPAKAEKEGEDATADAPADTVPPADEKAAAATTQAPQPTEQKPAEAEAGEQLAPPAIVTCSVISLREATCSLIRPQ